MTAQNVVEILQQDNPRHDRGTMHLYAAAFIIYEEARANIAKNGAVVAHPRTGEPLNNPYLQIMQKQRDALIKIANTKRPLKTDRLWQLAT